MNGFVDDLRHAWNRPESGLIRLILLNVFLYAGLSIFYLVCSFGSWLTTYYEVLNFFTLPADPSKLLFRPWTLLTYGFSHTDFFHILSNMLMLYWFGIILKDLYRSRRVVAVYVWGVLTGGICYLLFANLVPGFSSLTHGHLIGASAGVYAVTVATATLAPDYVMHLLLIGPVRIKYIAAVALFLSFIGTASQNAGGNLAHLGGGLMGYLFVVNMRRGRDWSLPVTAVVESVSGLFQRKRSTIRVSHRKETVGGYSRRTSSSYADEPDQQTIDAILDKISEYGYDKLTPEEKQTLFKASQRKS